MVSAIWWIYFIQSEGKKEKMFVKCPDTQPPIILNILLHFIHVGIDCWSLTPTKEEGEVLRWGVRTIRIGLKMTWRDMTTVDFRNEKKGFHLYSYAEVPHFMQGNPYITHGYRAFLTSGQCLRRSDCNNHLSSITVLIEPFDCPYHNHKQSKSQTVLNLICLNEKFILKSMPLILNCTVWYHINFVHTKMNNTKWFFNINVLPWEAQ